MAVLSYEKKRDLILKKFHGHGIEQWENELKNQYPWCELPFLIEMIWEEAQQASREHYYKDQTVCEHCGSRIDDYQGCKGCGHIIE